MSRSRSGYSGRKSFGLIVKVFVEEQRTRERLCSRELSPIAGSRSRHKRAQRSKIIVERSSPIARSRGSSSSCPMVLRGLVERHARSFTRFGATVTGVESITRDARAARSYEVRGSRPNDEETQDEGATRGRRYPCHGLSAVETRFSRGVLPARLLMNNGTWPYSFNRRRIKRSRRKVVKGRPIRRYYRRLLFL